MADIKLNIGLHKLQIDCTTIAQLKQTMANMLSEIGSMGS